MTVAAHGDECTQPRGKKDKTKRSVSSVLYSYPTAALRGSPALHTSNGPKLCLAANETPREMLEYDEKVTAAIFF